MNWHAVVELCVAANKPTCIWGSPGIGKTSFIYGLSEAIEMLQPAEVVIASLREPSDFLGFPVKTGKGLVMEPPAWAIRLLEAGKGLLVLDEITTAPPAVQSALLRVILERVVGDIELPQAVRVIAIANSAEEAGGWDLSLPLTNRFMHVKAEALGSDDWARGLIGGWNVVPSFKGAVGASEEASLRARSEIGGFLSVRGDLMMVKPSEKDKDKEAWPSPRTWEMTADVLAVGYTVGAPELVLNMIVQGGVGTGAGREFVVWKKALDLPDPKKLLAKPESWKVPKRSDIVFAVLGNAVGYAVQQMKKGVKAQESWESAWNLLGHVVKSGQPDVAVPAGQTLAIAGKDLKMEVTERVAELASEFVPILGVGDE